MRHVVPSAAPYRRWLFGLGCLLLAAPCVARAEVVDVEGQPLGANVARLLEALEFLGAPLDAQTGRDLMQAAQARDARRLQELLDPQVLVEVSINPESRVKVARGQAAAELQQAGFVPVIVKVRNESTGKARLRITSPQAGPPYAGVAELSMKRQDQEFLRENENSAGSTDRFLELEMFTSPPMTTHLSGLAVEYALALIYTSESGQREATIGFDVDQGTQDLGFRGEVPILFDVRAAVPVKLRIRDEDGSPTAARLVFKDARGHVYPPQGRRLAPDFFFQEQIYRDDGGIVWLPPGTLTVTYSRGPEYKVLAKEVTIADEPQAELEIQLKRWVAPAKFGFYSGDHHIHAAGCAHYTSPTQGVLPEDMFVQVKGEGLNVGCVLTWGPCFDYQRQFFSERQLELSEATTVLKYDLEISGFGSQSLGHVCLLNLRDQTYPGSEGTSTKGWPTWTTPVMRWAKQQGAITGYAHSASGLQIDPQAAAERLISQLDKNSDGSLNASEAADGLLPADFAALDADGNSQLSNKELVAGVDRAADELPNLAVPEMNGVGAMEICVTTAEGVCDMISAMDTARIQEWNMWYHILNCGFPLKVSGETDFPCMSSTRVGQGRVYVQLGDVKRIDFPQWCQRLAEGRSYVSDGFAHPLEFTVNDVTPGVADVQLSEPGEVRVQARVAFAEETPLTVAQGNALPAGGRRLLGDTVNLHLPRSTEVVRAGERLVELIANGRVAASTKVTADGEVHDISFNVHVERSSWLALRHFPQMHTNPVNVIVDQQPIRASRASALWCLETIRQLWRNRSLQISEPERAAAAETFARAQVKYVRIAAEAQEGT